MEKAYGFSGAGVGAGAAVGAAGVGAAGVSGKADSEVVGAVFADGSDGPAAHPAKETISINPAKAAAVMVLNRI